jgi:two-component system LytT family response regulator
MAMIKVAIVEDEALAREHVRQLVVKHDQVELIGECTNGKAAIDLILADKPDLVFLDIDLMDMTGFDVLDAIPEEQRPMVIFVTSFDRYAIRSIEVSASDYLVKPIETARFQRALDTAIQRIEEFG